MVRMSRNLYLKYAPFLLLTALLLWPLALNGHPFYIPDSASYLRGGATGIDTGILMLREWLQDIFASAGGLGTAPASSSSAVVAGAVSEAGGTRSLSYSLVSYLLRMPGHTLFALVVGQAGAVAFVVLVTQRVVAPRASMPAKLVMMAGMALLTSAAWNATTAIPDILAGIIIFGSIPLTLYLERLGVAERVVLVLLLAFAITAHASHLPIAAAALAAGAFLRFRLRRSGRAEAARDGVWFLGVPVLALVTQFALSYAAFGTVSIAPKRYPIALARSVEDGPGLRHLQENCETKGYAICEVFGTNIPTDHQEFLWGQNGVRHRASPEQMERIRAEEWPIILHAAAEYPGMQLSMSASNFLRQFGSFGLASVNFKGALTVGSMGRIELADVSGDWPRLRTWATAAIYLTTAGTLLMLLLLRRHLTRLEASALLVVTSGLVANAAVCGILSGVADRYQGRVMWTMPVLLMVILLRVRSDGDEGLPLKSMPALDQIRTDP